MKLWMRVGASIDITAEEADAILGDTCCEGMADIIRTAFKDGRFYLDGSTYVPEEAVEDFNHTYDTNYVIFEPECDL